jgi:hypothetical protein
MSLIREPQYNIKPIVQKTPIPTIFSDIYHNTNPSRIEEMYIEYYIAAINTNDVSNLLKLYNLASLNNDYEMTQIVTDLFNSIFKSS